MDEPIVFFGTGPVAAASLMLLAQSFEIEAVITKPRPSHHRGEFPVIDIAIELGLPIIEVSNKKTVTEKLLGRIFTSRVAVLIDFGIIVEQSVIDAFPFGIVNSHFSLLPQWRGADPITFAILSGQPKTGVSLMLLVAAMDEGPLLAVGETDLNDTMTNGDLTRDLIKLSNTLLVDVLPKYLSGQIIGSPQEKIANAVGYSPVPSYSHKVTKEDGILEWSKDADRLAHEVRAYSDWPKSRTMLGGHAVIIIKAHAEDNNGHPGEVWREQKRIGVYCSSGSLVIDRLKPANKSEMPIDAFINGYGKDL